MTTGSGGQFLQAQGDAFATVAAALARPEPVEPVRLADSCGLHGRLLSAAAGIAHGKAGVGDLAALLGAVLRRETARTGRPARLQIHASLVGRQGGREVLHRSGLKAVSLGPDIELHALAWEPAWLSHAGCQPLAATDACLLRRRSRPAFADPFFRDALGFSHHTSAGQREATRAVVLARPRELVLVSLPTGAGKTVVGLARALSSQRRGTTVVLVPTISLARDHEAELRALAARDDAKFAPAHRDFAFLSSTPEPARRAIIDRVSDGTQAVVLMSPEAVLGSLGRAVAQAAGNGLIDALVVDEAHMVTEWGDAFREEFQLIGAFARGIRDRYPDASFPTVLLSATLTDETCRTLRRTFGVDDGPTSVVVEANLRPEPEYWTAACATEAEREARLIEAVSFVPRPCIVYVNRPSEAEALAEALRNAGFLRIAAYHGDTPDASREEVERGWRSTGSATHIDVVVATAAFGLGINQNDVRAVIHARPPESLLRFYQEVGRSGRDGRSSLSLMLIGPEDALRAERLARRTVLTDRLEPRWNALWNESKQLATSPPTYWFNLDTVPPDLRGRGQQRGTYNRKWNTHALALLQRAGLLQLVLPAGVEPPTSDSRWIAGTIPHDVPLAADSWREQTAQERARTQVDTQRGLDALRELFAADCQFEDVLRRALSLHLRTVAAEGEEEISPSASCSGCPGCRACGIEPHVCPPNLTVIVESRLDNARFSRVLDQFGEGEPAVFTYQDSEASGILPLLIQRAIHAGLRILTTHGQAVPARVAIEGALVEAQVVVDENPSSANATVAARLKRPTIALIGPDTAAVDAWVFEEASGYRRVIVAPARFDDPTLPGRAIETTRPVLSASDLGSLLTP